MMLHMFSRGGFAAPDPPQTYPKLLDPAAKNDRTQMIYVAVGTCRHTGFNWQRYLPVPKGALIDDSKVMS
jgi:hypothetical protein